MQNAATVLDVIDKRGARGLPVERLYRQLFNPQLFLMAYGKLYSNAGAMTPGVTGETVDGMSLAKIEAIIDALRGERYRWRPVKRIYIPKKNGKQRPLGLPSWSDKLVAEVVRLLLEAYYEPQFSGRSHGFRPGRGCHTALSEVVEVWKGTHWFIEGDISDCFGSLDHDLMVGILAEKIHDGRFLRLINRMLKAGYLEDWRWHATLSGSPQGGIASPVLSNIYLDRFDQYVEQRLLPEYNHGRRRRTNRAYQLLEYAIARARRRGDRAEARRLTLRRRQFPSQDPDDPDYRRLRYVATATTGCWGSPVPNTRPNRSNRGSRRSCARSSSWNCRNLRLWSPTPPARRRTSSAMRSVPNTPTPRSPATAGRSTERSGCSCPRPSSGSGARST
jgi:retron-type reverse transcriptase